MDQNKKEYEQYRSNAIWAGGCVHTAYPPGKSGGKDEDEY